VPLICWECKKPMERKDGEWKGVVLVCKACKESDTKCAKEVDTKRAIV
jgi:hypothetical protein